MITQNKCIACNSSVIYKHLELKDYFFSQENFTIYKCDKCGFEFTNPIPKEENIGVYYQTEDYLSHSNNKKSLFNKLYFIIRGINISDKIRYIKKYIKLNENTKVLDIGCGAGYFLHSLKKYKLNLTGVEPNINAREIAKSDFGIDSYSSLKDISNENKYDLITLWHVLEHVHELDEYLDSIKNLLNKDGKLVIALPMNSSYDCKKYKQYWAAYDVPRHLYHFNPESLKLLLERYDFKLVNQHALIFDSFFISLLSEKHKDGSSLKAVLNGFISNTKAYLMPNKYNYSSELFIFKK